MKRHHFIKGAAGCAAMLPALLLAQQQELETDNTVVVNAERLAPQALPVGTQVQTLSGDALTLRRQGTLGDTLAGLPGVHLDNFGGGAGRPVIRGQTMPRIEILSDGAALFDAASVSPDHAVTTEPLLLDSIEIVSGPAAIVYGGNAVTGAVNLVDSKVPKALPNNGASGSAELRYGSGDREKTAVGRVTAGAGSVAVHAEGARHRAGDYAVPGGGHLKDSFADTESYAAGLSWISAKGYLGAALSRQKAGYGLPGHTHANAVCHNHQDALHCAAHGSYEDPFGGYDDSHTARIRLRSERVDVRADYDELLPGLAHLRLRLSDTDYRHDEIDGVITPSRYSNDAREARLELTHAPLAGFTGTFGAQYTDSVFGGLNMNTLHQGIENALYFDFRSTTRAAFLTERRSVGGVEIEAGLRKEWRAAGATDRDMSWFVPDAPSSPVSASLGAAWQPAPGYGVTVNLSRSQRAPGLRELYAQGNNLATNSFELGLAGRSWFIFDETDRPDVVETTRALDLGLRKTNGATTFDIGVYHRDVKDYVFARLLDRDPARRHLFLMYDTADVRFSGIDGQLTRRLDATSSVTVFGDLVRATTKDGERVPRLPPARLGARYAWHAGPLQAEAEYVHTFRQDRIADYETGTAGYGMLNASLLYRFDAAVARGLELYLRGTNLADRLAYSHTSFVKAQSPLRGRNVVLALRQVF